MESTFKVSARALNALGKESIKDRYTAILELVKNSYDADSTNVHINIFIAKKNQDSYIEISDDGDGMTEKDIVDKWLTIGTSEKIKRKTTVKKRRKLGEKGVGRLSCAKLSGKLELKSAAKDNLISTINLDWNVFNNNSKTLDQIPVIIETDFNVNDENVLKKTGVYLKLSGLFDRWEKKEIDALSLQLRLLFSPVFKQDKFSIYLKCNTHSDYTNYQKINILSSQISPEISLSCKINPAHSQLSYSVSSEFHGKKVINSKGNKEYPKELSENLKLREKLGPITINLKLFTRSKTTFILNPSIKAADVRNFLENNSGIRLFRDQVRIRPYGEPRNIASDWLGLAKRHSKDPAGVSRKTYKVNESHLVGEIEITKDGNPYLFDNTSREGLIENEYFDFLKLIIISLIEVLEAERHNALKSTPVNIKQHSKREVTRELEISVNKALKSLDKVIQVVSKDHKDDLNETRENVKEVRKIVPVIKEIIEDAILFRSLASVGIVSSVFAHEVRSDLGFTEGVLADLVQSNTEVIDNEMKGFIDDAYKRIEKVSMWGVLTLNQLGIRKRQEASFNLATVVGNIINDFTPLLRHSNIEIFYKPEDLQLRAYIMDIESMIVNLLTNARHAAIKNQDNKRIISIEINKTNKHLYFSDSGKGIPLENVEKIWKPLFTTKTHGEGTGLGLTIVKNISDDLKTRVSVGSNIDMKGALFCLDFSGVNNV